MPKHGRLTFKGDKLFVKSKKKRITSAKEKAESFQSQVPIWQRCCVVVSLGRRPIIRVRFWVIEIGIHCLFLF